MTVCVSDFYMGQNVFITGASGFMGKVLVEKLLRSCSQVESLYLLFRYKESDGFNCQGRLSEFKQNKIFSRIEAKAWEKVRAVSGDVSHVNLGLDKCTRAELVSKVTIIFHMAASVRFDEPFKSAVLLNTRGTREILQLAREMKKIKALVHISTAYCNPLETVLEENVYPPASDPERVIKMAENIPESVLNIIEQRFLGRLPNTYVFSKSLAESIVYDTRNELPICIVRPSIVCPALREPFPGWADSSLGPMGMLVGAGSGLIRTAYANGDFVGDLLPVDFAINAIIAIACQTAQHSQHARPLVVNCTTSNEAPITMNKFLELGKRIYAKYPHERAFWFPGGGMQNTKLKYMILFILTQFIPALLFDSAMFLVGQKSGLLRLQRRIFCNLRTFQFFLINTWEFKNSNLRNLLRSMNAEDRKEFNFDASNMNYEHYVDVWTLGVRRYMMGQDDSTILMAKNKYMRLKYLHFALRISLWWLFAWTIGTLCAKLVPEIVEWHQLILMLP